MDSKMDRILVICQALRQDKVLSKKARIRRWRAENKDRLALYHRKHILKYPDRVNARNAAWRAARLQATPPWVDKRELQAIYSLAQAYTEATGEPWHVDHIIPLNGNGVCGLHVVWNLQILRGCDNIVKGAHYAR